MLSLKLLEQDKRQRQTALQISVFYSSTVAKYPAMLIADLNSEFSFS